MVSGPFKPNGTFLDSAEGSIGYRKVVLHREAADEFHRRLNAVLHPGQMTES